MNSVMGRILDVNQVVQQLVDGGHPSSEEVRSCQDHLNSRYGCGEGGGGGEPWGQVHPRGSATAEVDPHPAWGAP